MSMLMYILDIFSTVVFAISGVILARRTKLDIVGALFLGTVTAVGGGTLRDTVLGIRPVFWVSDPLYIYVIVAVSLLSYIFLSFKKAPANSLRVADALGLAVVTAIGASKALSLGMDPIICITMGVLTGVMGGIIRDTIANRMPIVFADSILYATAAFLGATAMVGSSMAGLSQDYAVVTGVAVTLIIRISAIIWKIKLPPFFRVSRNTRQDV